MMTHLTDSHLLLLFSQTVPHGGNDLRHLSKRSVGVLALDGCLRIAEEQRVSGNRLLRLVGIFFLLAFFGSSSNTYSFPGEGGRSGGHRCGRLLRQSRGERDDAGRDGKRDRGLHQHTLLGQKEMDRWRER